MNDLKLLGRNENDLKKEIKILQTIGKSINMKKKKKKCAKICLKRGSVQSKLHIRNTIENDIKELDPRKAYKYLDLEENFDIQHKNEKKKAEERILEEIEISFGYRIKCKE
jgi:hypothetical protein